MTANEIWALLFFLSWWLIFLQARVIRRQDREINHLQWRLQVKSKVMDIHKGVRVGQQ